MNRLRGKFSRTKKIIPILIIVTTMGLLESCSNSAVRNDINGSFEEIFDGKNPDGWYANNLSGTRKYADLSVDHSVSHSGKQSIKIAFNKKMPHESFMYNWVRRVDGLKSLDVFELQGWIKTTGIKNSPSLEVQFFDQQENKLIGTISTKERFPITGTNNWKKVSIIFKIPPKVNKILLFAGVNGLDNDGGKVWFDDISITPLKKRSDM